jgi:branched-chain amino acid transport system substrate-binding protein
MSAMMKLRCFSFWTQPADIRHVAAAGARRDQKIMRCGRAVAVSAMLLACWTGGARAQISDGLIKIGVLSNQSTVGSDASGVAAATAARLAVEDFGGAVNGVPVQVIDEDFAEKPDTAALIARRWFDKEQVDAIVDMPVSSAALAVNEIARNARKTLLVGGAATADITGKACSPFTTHWTDNSRALTSAVVQGVTEKPGETWFFVAVDYALGASLQRDATAEIERIGGKVLGGVRYPLGAPDLASFLLQAQASQAHFIGLASIGKDTINAVKQAGEFHLQESGQQLAAFLVFITDIHGLGLEAAQGLNVAAGFYWDQNALTRKFAERMFARHQKMPTKEQAAVYASVRHYLKAIQAAGTDDARIVNRKMREMPVDYFGQTGAIRPDGRVLYDLTLYKVKSPAASKYAWDYYQPVRVIAKDVAFGKLGDNGCKPETLEQ